MIADAPHFADHHEAPAHGGADRAIWNAIGVQDRRIEARAAGMPDRRFLPDQPDRARQRDHGRMQPYLRARRSKMAAE